MLIISHPLCSSEYSTIHIQCTMGGKRLCTTHLPNWQCFLPPQASDIAWASRWDTYLHMSDVEVCDDVITNDVMIFCNAQIHWFAICNSVAIVLFLSGKSSNNCLSCKCHHTSLYRNIGTDHCTYTQERYCPLQPWWRICKQCISVYFIFHKDLWW